MGVVQTMPYECFFPVHGADCGDPRAAPCSNVLVVVKEWPNTEHLHKCLFRVCHPRETNDEPLVVFTPWGSCAWCRTTC